MVSVRDKAISEIKSDLFELKKIIAQQQNLIPQIQSIRRYEWLAFEKAREMIMQGEDAWIMKNPYEAANGKKKTNQSGLQENAAGPIRDGELPP